MAAQIWLGAARGDSLHDSERGADPLSGLRLGPSKISSGVPGRSSARWDLRGGGSQEPSLPRPDFWWDTGAHPVGILSLPLLPMSETAVLSPRMLPSWKLRIAKSNTSPTSRKC